MNGTDSKTKRCWGIAESGGRCPAQTHGVQGEWVAEAEKPGKGREEQGQSISKASWGGGCWEGWSCCPAGDEAVERGRAGSKAGL